MSVNAYQDEGCDALNEVEKASYRVLLALNKDHIRRKARLQVQILRALCRFADEISECVLVPDTVREAHRSFVAGFMRVKS